MNHKEFVSLIWEEINKEYKAKAESLCQVAGNNPIKDSRTAGFLEGLDFVQSEMQKIISNDGQKPVPAADRMKKPPDDNGWTV